jgi:hypothetical protein
MRRIALLIAAVALLAGCTIHYTAYNYAVTLEEQSTATIEVLAEGITKTQTATQSADGEATIPASVLPAKP